MNPDYSLTEPRQKRDEEQLKHRHSLAWLLDSSIPLPGGFRIGLDGIIGLIPGIGDLIGGGLSTWLLYQAYQQNIPKMIIARMLVNILIDAGLGSIPIIGDIFDFFWKSNLRNAELLDRYRREPQKTYRHSTVANFVFLAGVVTVVVILMYIVITLISLLWNALFQGQTPVG